MKRFLNFNALVITMFFIIGSSSIFGKCNKEDINNLYVLTLNSNPSYMLKAYADVNLTTPVADLNKINKDTTIYIVVPKPRGENTAVQVSGADKITDTVATVKMTGNKTITAAYTLDTANFTFTVDKGEATITKYTNTNNYKSIELPSSYQGNPVKTIGQNSSTTSAVLPNTIEFAIIPNTVITVEDNSFYNCSALKKIVLSSNLQSIGQGAFNGCTALTSITLPATLQTLNSGVTFIDCSNLTTIWVLAAVPPSFTTGPQSIFPLFQGAIPSSLTLYLPNSSKATYSTATSLGGNWTSATDIGVPNMQIVWY